MGEIGTHEFGDASWMWFVPTCLAVAVGCDSIWMWLVPTCVAVTVGCGSILAYMARWQMDVVGVLVYGGGSGEWLVSTFLSGLVGSGWCPRVWRC